MQQSPTNRTVLFVFFALAVALGVALVVFAALDIEVSGLFYVPGEGFPARFGSPYHAGVRTAVRVVAWASGVGLIGALVWRVLIGRRLLGVSRQVVVYLILALLLGPGVLANSILKENWGRARPSQIVEFGGDKIYTPPLVIADQCATNCSFVSGDASVGFIFLALGFAARRRGWRIAGFAVGAGLGGLFGVTRIAQGGHFLSDVLFSAGFMLALSWLLYELVVRRDFLAPVFARLPRDGP